MNLNIEFYRYGVEKAFSKYKMELMEKGFTEKEANDFLEDIYSVVSEEYGG